MRVFIAEKKSLAEDIAANLPGAKTGGKGFIRVGNDVVTWLAGHVLEQCKPEDYDAKFKEWKIEDLPIVPNPWKLKVHEDKQRYYNDVTSHLRNASAVVNAGDADREGQLIVDEVLNFYGFRGRVDRLWVQGQDTVNMKRALSGIFDNREKAALSLSSLTRQRADWIVGYAFSRALSIVARRYGYRRPFSVGRVIMPALKLVVMRDLQIENFVPLDHYGVEAELLAAPGTQLAVDWKPALKKPGIDDEGRCTVRGVAEKLVTAATGARAKVTVFDREAKIENAPLPFDLGSLSQVVGARLRLKPKRVLEIVQALYDKKLVTYPRTESRYLPAAQFEEAAAVFAAIAANSPEHAQLLTGANAATKSRAWNDAKTKSHHAIIPTLHRASTSSLGGDERAVYDLIVRGYIAQFYPPYSYERTSVEVELAGERFTMSGRVPKASGWRDVLGASKSEEKEIMIPTLTVGAQLPCAKATLKQRKTEPPARYTENSLQTDMINAHKYVEDERMRALLKSEEDGKHPGIGTPATQPDIIDKLGKLGYTVAGPKDTIVSTAFGRMLIERLPKGVTDIGLTALFEMHLFQISTGETLDAKFNAVLIAYVRKNVAEIAQIKLPPPSAEISAMLESRGSSSSRRKFAGRNKSGGSFRPKAPARAGGSPRKKSG